MTLHTTTPAPGTLRADPSATPLLETSKVTSDDGAKGRTTAGSRSPARSTDPGSAASDNRAAEPATSDGNGLSLPTAVPLNLYEKLAAISKAVAIKATGSTAQGQENHVHRRRRRGPR